EGGGGGRNQNLPSPLLHDGLLYHMNTGGTMEVIDAKDGERVYRQRLPIGQSYASVTLAGGLLYAFDVSGKSVVFKPGRKFERVATNSVEGTGGCPTFAGEHLYVRGSRNLYCVSTKPQSEPKKDE